MRAKLKEARVKAGLTQEQVAEKLGITLRYYKDIEAGVKVGSFEIWDAAEDLFNVHQRVLREIDRGTEGHPKRYRADRKSGQA